MSKDKLIPELRFPEFEGDGEWIYKRLGETGKIITGKTPSTKDASLWNGEILFITPTDIDENQKYQLVTNRTIVRNRKLNILPEGSIAYTCIASIGKMSITAKESVTNQQINSIVVNANYHNEFIYYSLLHITPFIKSRPATSTLPIVNKTEFSAFRIGVPIPQEQQKIASCLSSLDELIAAHNDKLDALKDHKKGLLQNLFPQEGETVPKVRFPEFEDDGEWEETTLEQVADYENGKAHEKDIDENGDYIVVNSKFISTEGETVKYSDTAFCPANLGDILMVLSDVPNGKAIAKCFYVDEENRYSVNQRICRITATDCDSRFLFYIMDRNAYFLSFDDGVKQTNLRKSDVLEFPFRIPADSVEQTKIASCISAVDELIKSQSAKIEELNQHKRGLMQGLFPKIKS